MDFTRYDSACTVRRRAMAVLAYIEILKKEKLREEKEITRAQRCWAKIRTQFWEIIQHNRKEKAEDLEITEKIQVEVVQEMQVDTVAITERAAKKKDIKL